MSRLQALNDKEVEKAIIVGLVLPSSTEEVEGEYLDELAFLAETAGAVVTGRFIQKLDAINPRTFVGSGKIREIADFVKEKSVDLVIFDDELSPSQIRNLEEELRCKILDRNNLILDIFARRARTAHAKTQVELAQYQYLLPRLAGMWTHLERQKGGIGLRGPGETEIETDRRIIRDKISLLKKRLERIDRQKVTQRKGRKGMIRAAIIGYTNVGKSTLMNYLSGADVFAENKLFATLDTTVRKVVVENLPFLLSDTVGFIRKLPHHLIESFKSTLDEVREADILLHVVDISHPGFLEQIKVVQSTLTDLGAGDKSVITIFNKIDAYSQGPGANGTISLEDFKHWWVESEHSPCIFISALKEQNLSALKHLLYETIKVRHMEIYPHRMLY